METYIRVQTAGDVFRNAARLYLGHFRVFFLAYLIPVAPILVLATRALVLRAQAGAQLALFLLWMALAYVMTIPIMAIISDICLGNAPGVRRAYRHVFGRATGKVAPALLAAYCATMLGFALFIVPGLVIMTRLMMLAPALVLERRPILDAFRRSAELGRGYYVRNLFIAIVAIVLTLFLGTVVVVIVTMLLTQVAGLSPGFALGVGQTVALVFGPFATSVVVLLYYDMRARKEAYDSAKLAEDLHR